MPKRNLEVFVPGTPIQQGSMKAFTIRHSNGTLGVSMVHNKGNLLTAWRERIRVALIEKYPEQLDGSQTDGGYHPRRNCRAARGRSDNHGTSIFCCHGNEEVCKTQSSASGKQIHKNCSRKIWH